MEIEVLHREGMGISSISRVLSMPKASVQRRIERMKKKRPVFTESGQVYEVDELYTYNKSKSALSPNRIYTDKLNVFASVNDRGYVFRKQLIEAG